MTRLRDSGESGSQLSADMRRPLYHSIEASELMELDSSGDIAPWVTNASAATRSSATSTATGALKNTFNKNPLARCEESMTRAFQQRTVGNTAGTISYSSFPIRRH